MNHDLHKRLHRIDLNLLPVLLILIETQSTQATADKIGRTQSAVSHALNRLREMLGDTLFIRKGPKLIPTALALELKAPLTQLLNDSALLVERGYKFVPEASDRNFVIGCFDLAMPLAQVICKELQARAPNMSFQITGPTDGDARLLRGDVDLLISLYRNSAKPGQNLFPVGSVEWAYYAAAINKPKSDPPSLQDWLSCSHVQVDTGPSGRSPIDDAARIHGVEREIGLQVNGFMEALYVVSQGDYYFTTFPKLVEPIAQKLSIHAHALPFYVAPAPVSLVSRNTKFDPLASWASEIAVQTVRDIL